MGSPPGEGLYRRPDEDQVTVAITRGYWLGATEVTKGEWKRFMGPSPHDRHIPDHDRKPVQPDLAAISFKLPGGKDPFKS